MEVMKGVCRGKYDKGMERLEDKGGRYKGKYHEGMEIYKDMSRRYKARM